MTNPVEKRGPVVDTEYVAQMIQDALHEDMDAFTRQGSICRVEYEGKKFRITVEETND